MNNPYQYINIVLIYKGDPIYYSIFTSWYQIFKKYLFSLLLAVIFISCSKFNISVSLYSSSTWLLFKGHFFTQWQRVIWNSAPAHCKSKLGWIRYGGSRDMIPKVQYATERSALAVGHSYITHCWRSSKKVTLAPKYLYLLLIGKMGKEILNHCVKIGISLWRKWPCRSNFWVSKALIRRFFFCVLTQISCASLLLNYYREKGMSLHSQLRLSLSTKCSYVFMSMNAIS